MVALQRSLEGGGRGEGAVGAPASETGGEAPQDSQIEDRARIIGDGLLGVLILRDLDAGQRILAAECLTEVRVIDDGKDKGKKVMRGTAAGNEVALEIARIEAKSREGIGNGTCRVNLRSAIRRACPDLHLRLEELANRGAEEL